MTSPDEQRRPAMPDLVETLFREGLACHRRGHHARAEEIYLQILGVRPGHAPVLHLLGSLALQAGAASRACELLARSVDANPSFAVAHLDLANALHLAGRPEAALESYDRAVAIKRDLVAAHFNKAVVLQDLDRPEDALKAYDSALRWKPDLFAGLYNRAVLLQGLRRHREALAAYDRCLALCADHVESLSNRAAVLLELDRPDEALASLDRALRIAPGLGKALNNRGNALHKMGRFTEAVASFDQALEAEPRSFEALRNRAGSLRKLGQPAAALTSLDAAIQIKLEPRALLDRAEILVDLRRYEEANGNLTQLLDLAPDTGYARGLRLHLQGLLCDWRDFDEHARTLVASVDAGRRADYPFPFLSVADAPASQRRCAETFVADKFPVRAPPSKRRKRGHPRIRVGYLSADFREHALSALMVRVFESHDRRRFEPVALSLRPEEDSPLGRRVRGAFDTFIDLGGMSDRAAAGLIRDRHIDILVDLMGYTQGSRTAIPAQRPAPLQVNYLGYPGTMGAPFIDYLIADEFVVPAAQRRHYGESIVCLPECFQANDDRRAVADTIPNRREWGLPDFGLVFCCFNNSYKIKPACFGVWMRLLRSVPASVLWLLGEDRAVENNLRREAVDRGVDPARLIFAGRAPYDAHLSRLRCADLFLDTLPFNAGTTASDALWAGVPLVTCAGEAFAGRMAGSLLNAVGLPELVAHTLDAYEALALGLATTPALLGELRGRLARNRLAAPLFDGVRFCRHLESAYEIMWQRFQSGRKPESFAVPRLPRAP
jgi:predicted O-linked N-acetylglucosamine transferase (SPINDLY family)